MSDDDRRKMVVVGLGSILATAALIALTFSLGSWAFRTRHHLSHERRLARLLEQNPTAADVTTALLAEPGTVELPAPRSEADLLVNAGKSGVPSEDVGAKYRAAAEVRVFHVGGAVYVLFFGADRRLQSYLLLD
jgi:hypothetical protein